jgi:beta-lactamase regulating signal transducer with metallopeptidase domain
MNGFFSTFLWLTVSGSVLVMLMMIIRRVFNNRLPKTWIYYLWIIVLIRFLVPVSTPWDLSAMSILPLPNRVSFSIFQGQHGEPVISDSEYYGHDIKDVPEATGIFQIDDLPHRQFPQYDLPLRKSVVSENILNILGVIWLIGTIMMLFYTFIGYFMFRRSLRKTCREVRQPELLRLYKEAGEALNIKKLPALYESSSINAPLQVGFLSPFLLLPERLIVQQNQDLRYFLMHELVHYRRCDVLYKWIIQFCICLYWFNPFVYIMKRELNILCELSCDTSVLRKLESKEREDYGDVLLKAIEIEFITKQLPSFGVAWGNEKKILKDRFKNIMDFKKHRKSLWLLMVALMLFLGVFSVAAGPASSNRALAAESERNDARQPASGILKDNDSGKIIERNLEIITSSPTLSRYSLDYINAHKAEYNEIIALGSAALQYMLPISDNGMKGAIMASACRDIYENVSVSELLLYSGSQVPDLELCCTIYTGPYRNKYYLNALTGTYSWRYMGTDGITEATTEADSMHPLDSVEYMDIITESDGIDTIKLNFAIPPKSYSVRRWSDAYVGNSEAFEQSFEQVKIYNDNVIFLADYKGYIYEVSAIWPQGSASYSFYIK